MLHNGWCLVIYYITKIILDRQGVDGSLLNFLFACVNNKGSSYVGWKWLNGVMCMC